MGNFKLRWRAIAHVMLFSAAAFLVCGTALAQGTAPVNGFVIINPISVCSGGICAPYGASCTSATGKPVCTKSPAPSLATTTTPIGFVDTDTKVNLTRAFWAQAGIDVVFFPVQSYTSPANTIDSSWNNITDAASTTGAKFTYSSTNYQNLHLVNVLCADGFIALTSPDFQALTQHSICNDHMGLAPGSYSKLANPPPAPSPAPPLAINGCSQALPCSTNSNAIDTFFVNTYAGTGVFSPQYGFSWINGDGVSVGNVIFSVIEPRYDTLAHEIGHALALTHLNFGATADTTNNALGNMMLLGTTRATSYNSGCQGITGNFSNPPPILNNGALFDLDYTTSTFNPCNGAGQMLADHLVLQPSGQPSACPSPLDPTTCSTQEGAAALSPFINKTAPNTANAGGGTQAPIAGAATTSTTSSSATPLTGTPAPLQITVTATGDPDSPDLLFNIIALLPSNQLSFNGNQPVAQIGGTPKSPGLTCDANNLSNCAVTIASVVKLSNQQVSGNPGCDSGSGQPPSSQCVRITYNPGFRPGDNIVLAVSFNKDAGVIITNNLLTGTQWTSSDANGFSTTTLFAPAVNGFIADSGNPDLATANVLLNASTFQNASAVKLGKKLAQCTPPYITVISKNGKQTTIEVPDGNLPDHGE
jgi:hypothetical protein